MGGLWRWFKHLGWDAADTRRHLDTAALARVQARVQASELRHSGEIRVCVEGGLPLSYLRKRLPARARALMLFSKLRVWDTKDNNGVLIYMLMADHAIEVVADRGLARRVPPGTWDTLVQAMRENFRAGRFEAGLLQAVDAVDGLLVAHYALTEGQRNPNELPDPVWLL
ncbi:MAG: TPM domain-containing protein [Rubrivivax sp.]